MATNWNFGEVIINALQNQQLKQMQAQQFQQEMALRQGQLEEEKRQFGENMSFQKERAKVEDTRSERDFTLNKEKLLTEVREKFVRVADDYKPPEGVAGSVLTGEQIEGMYPAYGEEIYSEIEEKGKYIPHYMWESSENALSRAHAEKLEGMRHKNNLSLRDSELVPFAVKDSEGNIINTGFSSYKGRDWANNPQYYGPGKNSVVWNDSPYQINNDALRWKNVMDNGLRAREMRNRSAGWTIGFDPFGRFGFQPVPPSYSPKESKFLEAYSRDVNALRKQDPNYRAAFLDFVAPFGY